MANYGECEQIERAMDPRDDYRVPACCCYPSKSSTEDRGREYARHGRLSVDTALSDCELR
eukprot:scaffold4868_cov416-Prasinococcus_capsulatus_cf.AAC.15